LSYVVSPVKYASHIKVGNHLAVPTAKGWLHHMIVTKMDRRADGTVRVFVVHFWAATYKKADATIRRSILINSGELACAGLLLRMQYQHFTRNGIPQRARWLTRYNRAEYSLFHRNCEHAASWLRTGYTPDRRKPNTSCGRSARPFGTWS
jgi:hypothetical protein